MLKPGGRFLCLEFSSVEVPLLDTLYDAYSFNAIPALGALVAGDARPIAISSKASAASPIRNPSRG